MKVLVIAQVAHLINSAYCQAIGDPVAPAWAECPEDVQKGVLYGVQLHLDNPDTTPEQSHESWLADKAANGWVYGETKDFAAKTHPCILPYADLPESQKAKDHIFRAVVHALKDIPDADEAVEDAIANLTATSGAGAAVSVATPAAVSGFQPGAVGIKYIGRREVWNDTVYRSGLSFTTEQVRPVPGPLARMLLRHPDLFQEVELPQPEQATDTSPASPSDDTSKLLEQGKEQAQKDDRSEDFAVIDQVNQMTDKDALADFALSRFQLKVAKNQKIEGMRAKVVDHINRFGV